MSSVPIEGFDHPGADGGRRSGVRGRRTAARGPRVRGRPAGRRGGPGRPDQPQLPGHDGGRPPLRRPALAPRRVTARRSTATRSTTTVSRRPRPASPPPSSAAWSTAPSAAASSSWPGWTPGPGPPDDRPSTTRNLPRVAAACRRLHAGPRFASDFDMFAVQRRYLRLVRERGLPAARPATSTSCRRCDRIRAALAVRAGADGALPQRPARREHHRRRRAAVAHRLRVRRQQRPVLRARQHLERGRRSSSTSSIELVAAYYGRPPRSKVARARLLGLMSKYGWTLWASIQDGRRATSTSTSGRGGWRSTSGPSPSSTARTCPGCWTR